MEPLPVRHSHLIYQGKTLSLVAESVLLPSGVEHTHLTVTHPGAVVILPVTSDGEILLLRQYRHSLKRWILEFPAGTLNAGEEPLACAKRELPEETGFAAAHWRDLGLLYPAPGFCEEVQHLYFASELSPESAQKDEDELIELQTHSVDAVEALISSGEISDGKSLAAFLRARLIGLV
jgi:ADP-ribose pyrophosphatase